MIEATQAATEVIGQSEPVARYSVIHQTDYNYQSIVTLSQQYLHLTPRNFAYQQCLSHHIQVDPLPDDGSDSIDYFGNATRNLTLTMPMSAGLKYEVAYVHRYATEEADATEGLIAFKDKRKPVFGQR